MSNDLTETNKDIFCITLDTAELGKYYKIVSCNLPDAIKNRLEEMGMTVGATVAAVKLAPLGDPIELNVRGYLLCLRKSTLRGFCVVDADK